MSSLWRRAAFHLLVAGFSHCILRSPWALPYRLAQGHVSSRNSRMKVDDVPRPACQDIVSMKAQVPDAIFKKASTLTADAPPMLDMGAVQKAGVLLSNRSPHSLRGCEAADLINKAKRPILYVGQGSDLGDVAFGCGKHVFELSLKAQAIAQKCWRSWQRRPRYP